MKVRRQLDLKHSIEAEITGDCSLLEQSDVELRIVKHTNDQPIDLDKEPVALFRGRDRLALAMLNYYSELCRLDGANDFQMGQMKELIDRFYRFAMENPDVMKQPGITRGA